MNHIRVLANESVAILLVDPFSDERRLVAPQYVRPIVDRVLVYTFFVLPVSGSEHRLSVFLG